MKMLLPQIQNIMDTPKAPEKLKVCNISFNPHLAEKCGVRRSEVIPQLTWTALYEQRGVRGGERNGLSQG